MGAPREPGPGLCQPRGGDPPGCGMGPNHPGAIPRWSRSAGRGDATVRPATNGFSLSRRRTAEFEVPVGGRGGCGVPRAARRRGSPNPPGEEIPVSCGSVRRGENSAAGPVGAAPRRRCPLAMAVGRDALPGGVDGGGRLPGGRIAAGSDLAGCAGRRRSTDGWRVLRASTGRGSRCDGSQCDGTRVAQPRHRRGSVAGGTGFRRDRRGYLAHRSGEHSRPRDRGRGVHVHDRGGGRPAVGGGRSGVRGGGRCDVGRSAVLDRRGAGDAAAGGFR